MSKVVRFHETGSAEVLQLDEVEIPLPADGEVRIKVEAFGLNRAEVMFREGQYLEAPQLPSRLGYEASGIVEAVGPGVSTPRIGERVSTIPAFSMGQYGVYGEAAIVPAFATVPYPDKLSAEEGTAIWMAYITAYGALVDQGQVKASDYVLITAASSSVGLAAIQIAKSQGATVIAVTRKPGKVDFLKEHGADFAIATESEKLVERVQTLTKGKGANLIFDPIGGPILEDLANAAAAGATIIEYGALAASPTPYPLFAALAKGLVVKGYTLFEITQHPKKLQKAKDFIFNSLSAGTLKPIIDRVFQFADVADAHRYMESNQQKGKIVVTLN